MKIYSWNMLFENERLDDAFSFVSSLDFDILCLQEVPDEFLARLNQLPVHLASSVEYNYTLRDGLPRQTHSVILSTHPISSYEDIPVPNWFLRPGLRERITTSALRLLRIWKWTRSNGVRNHLRALVEIPDIGLTQIYSVHLTIHSPKARRVELDAIRKQHDARLPTILCGDLNIFEKYRVALPSWLFGATIFDVLWPQRERMNVEKEFASLGLHNPLYGKLTHPMTQCQLDHILLSAHFPVSDAEVVFERYGSDHNPIHVESNR